MNLKILQAFLGLRQTRLLFPAFWLFLGGFSLGGYGSDSKPFKPDFKAQPIPVPAGTVIQPLCNNPKDLSCAYQLSEQALPLALMKGNNSGSDVQYFVPTFFPSGVTNQDPENNKNLKVWTPPSSSVSNSGENKQPSKGSYFYYQGQTYQRDIGGKIVRVKTDALGKKTVHTGEVRFVSAEDINSASSVGKGAASPLRPRPAPSSTLVLNKDSYALPATNKTPNPAGCFSFHLPDDKDGKTEAGYCLTCEQDDEAEPIVSTLIEDSPNFLRNMRLLLKKVDRKTYRKLRSQVGRGVNLAKICSPEKALEAIIQNFNRSCPKPYKNNFKSFFIDTHCASCKKGIPPEIMLAMMSVESAGRCPAHLRNEREDSVGLFQINSKSHQCRDFKGKVYRRNTRKNNKCLRDPINNLNKGIDILADHYARVNPQAIDRSECKSWTEMDLKEKDLWRRGVSAYNSGPDWVVRAIESARNPRTLKNTAHLISRYGRSQFRRDSASWENLRVYYFIEKLSPSNYRRSGRQVKLTLSNLAHTEAVLGRNIKNSSGMVDIWAKYKQQFLADNQVSCEKGRASNATMEAMNQQAIEEEKEAESERLRVLKQKSEDRAASTRIQAVSMAKEIGGKEGLAILNKLVQDKDRNVRVAVARAAGEVGGAKGLAILNKLVQDKDRKVRVVVAHAAGEVRGAKGLAILNKLAQDKDPKVRMFVNLEAADIEGAKGLAILNKLAQDKDPEVRKHARLYRATHAADKKMREARKASRNEKVSIYNELAQSEYPSIKVAILWRVSELEKAEDRLAFLNKMAQDKDPRIRESVALEAGRMGGAREVLRRLAQDNDQDVRVRARIYLR